MKFLLLAFFSISSFAWTPPQTFNSTYLDLEESILAATIRGHYRHAQGHISNATAAKILSDQDNLVSEEFKIPAYFQASVKFWFSIYTQYSSDQVVIHDINNLKIVYNVIDFSELQNNQNIHRFSKSKLQTKLSLEYTRRLKKNLVRMASTPASKYTQEEDDIYSILKNAGLSIPKKPKNRKKFFHQLAQNIRTQTGQRNKVFKGLVKSIPYMPYLKRQIKNFNLPEELLAIPFLESSFNPVAESKAAAVGIWQFMPYISNLFMPPIKDNLDYRLNPIISSIAAMHLLKENKLILKRWDLAVTAYNSGPKHLKKAIQILMKKKPRNQIGLDFILTHYSHPHIGFASENFYAEFLALVHVLSYKNIIYPLEGVKPSVEFEDQEHLKIYVAKNGIRPTQLFKLMKKSSPYLIFLNTHFTHIGDLYPKGTLIISDKELNDRKYYKITDQQILSRFPKNFFKLVK